MFSPLACEVYASLGKGFHSSNQSKEIVYFFSLGSVTGICSIWSLVFISYDRYNVIVKGMSGTPLTSGKATIYILFSWAYSIGWSIPPFVGWGAYIPEGNFVEFKIEL